MIDHPTDNLGWPVCECDACRLKSKRMNDLYIKLMMCPENAGRNLDAMVMGLTGELQERQQDVEAGE